MGERGKFDEQEIKEKLTEILAQCEQDRSRLIPVLQQTQETFGYLPAEAIGAIASHLGMADVQVYGVASFYNHFRFIPLGKNPIQMCLWTACHMVGGSLVLEAVERALGINVGGITEDGNSASTGLPVSGAADWLRLWLFRIRSTQMHVHQSG